MEKWVKIIIIVDKLFIIIIKEGSRDKSRIGSIS